MPENYANVARALVAKEITPDFSKLGDKYKELGAFFERSHADTGLRLDYPKLFKIPDFVKVLLQVLVKEFFDLNLETPSNQLIPRLTSRLAYVIWIHDLLHSEEANLFNGKHTTAAIRGIDIGTGPSCIYALLANRIYDWQMLCTDIDEVSIAIAKENVASNAMTDQIAIVKNPNKTELLIGPIMSQDEDIKYSFCMVNPPFYKDQEDYGRTFDKKCGPYSINTATANENFYEDGEYEFTRKLVEESTQLWNRVIWFTALSGKKETHFRIMNLLKKYQSIKINRSSILLGKTRRWLIGWKFLQEPKLKTAPTSKRPFNNVLQKKRRIVLE